MIASPRNCHNGHPFPGLCPAMGYDSHVQVEIPHTPDIPAQPRHTSGASISGDGKYSRPGGDARARALISPQGATVAIDHRTPRAGGGR
jgi:hypothetical protein